MSGRVDGCVCACACVRVRKAVFKTSGQGDRATSVTFKVTEVTDPHLVVFTQGEDPHLVAFKVTEGRLSPLSP